MLKTAAEALSVLIEAMLRRLDRPGPRSTSYPTVDRFVDAFGLTEYSQALAQRGSGATTAASGPLRCASAFLASAEAAPPWTMLCC